MKMRHHMHAVVKRRSADLIFPRQKEPFSWALAGISVWSSVRSKLSCCWKRCIANSEVNRQLTADTVGIKYMPFSLRRSWANIADDRRLFAIDFSNVIRPEIEGLLTRSIVWKFEAHAVEMEFVCEVYIITDAETWMRRRIANRQVNRQLTTKPFNPVTK